MAFLFPMNHEITYLAALSLSVLYGTNGDEHTVAVLTGEGDDDFAHFRWKNGVVTGDDGVSVIVPTNSPTGRWERIGGYGRAKLFLIVDPLAADADIVHALYDDTTAAFPGPFTNPDVPRNLVVLYTTNWDGGTVTITGTNQFDEVISEVFAAGNNSTVVGEKAFKTVTGAVKGTPAGVTGNGASIGVGDILGLTGRLVAAEGIVTAAGIAEAADFDITYNTFTPDTVPDAATTYAVVVNVS